MGDPLMFNDDWSEDDFNGRECPYFARYMGIPGHNPEATCAFGCVDEPSCVTDQPRGGWPPLSGVIAPSSDADHEGRNDG